MKNGIILGLFFIFISCDLIVREGIANAVSEQEVEILEGDYFTLKDNKIDIFLPKGFIVIADEDLLESYKLIPDENTRKFYERELESRRDNQVSHYNFYNDELASEVYVSGLPYTPFDKGSARELLYYLRKNHEKYLKATGIYHNKIKANYFGDSSLQVFKAVYRLSGLNSHDETQENYVETFKTIYLIKSKRKTMIMTILTPNRVDIDPFVSKIKF